MKHRSAVIKSLPQAYEVTKEMNLDPDHGESDYRTAGRQSLEIILEGRMQERVSATTVSRVAQSLDTAVAAFHRRPLKRQYRFLIFDGVVLKRKTGAGSVKRVVLVALGITEDGRKEVIDFSIAPGESQGAWEAFLTDLYRRGLS